MAIKTLYLFELAKRLDLEAWLYSFIYRQFRKIHQKTGIRVTTNNYGFYPTEIDAYDKYQLQMYEEYAKLLEAENVTEVLEIGSGAGGGLMHMQSRLPNAHFTGLDRCKEAVKTSQYFMGDQKTKYKLYTSLEDIIQAGKRFDAVVSVETGIFVDPQIFSTIHDLLKPGGVFIYYDSTTADKLGGRAKLIADYGFEVELFRDITENVFKSCEFDTPRRLELVNKYLPAYLKPLKSELLRYLCVKGSLRYKSFSDGIKKSFMLKARRIEITNPLSGTKKSAA